MPKITVIVVTYNGMKWIDACFGSLQKSLVPIDVIVIDNLSTDDTVTYIKTHFPAIKIIESTSNLGFGKANNLGISLAFNNGSDYFFLLNQDAWIFPDTIGNLVLNFKAVPKYGIISSIQLQKNLEVEYIFKSYINKYPILSEKYNPEKIYANKVLEIPFTNAAMWMISRENILKVGGFSPLFYHYGEDVDYLHRAKYHGFKTGVSMNSFGIHDRTVKPRKSVKEFNQKKQHPGPWPLRYYMILSNINYSFPMTLLMALRLFLVSLIKHAIKFNWFSVKYDFIVIKDVLFKLPLITSLRKETKISKTSFLK